MVRPGQPAELPEELAVLCYDGTVIRRKVIWESMPEAETGQADGYWAAGRAEGIQEPVSVYVKIAEGGGEEENLLSDGNWDEGMAQWESESSGEEVLAQIVPEFPEPFPAPPVNALRVEGKKNFSYRISQKVPVARPGRYCLSVEFRGTDTTNVDIRLFARFEEECRETVIHPSEHGWEEYQAEIGVCREGHLTVGIRMQSPPNYGMMRKFGLLWVGDL